MLILISFTYLYCTSVPAQNEQTGETDAYAWMNEPPHHGGLLLDSAGRAIYRQADTADLWLHPIAVTQDRPGTADALGYGVGNLHKGRLCVAHYARGCHWGCDEKYPEGASRAVVTYSDDYGHGWSPPRKLDLERSEQDGPEAAIGWGLAFAQVEDTTYLATSRGLFVSKDGGAEWTFRRGLRQGEGYLPGTGYGAGKVHIGPRMIHSQRAGLLLFGQPEDIQLGKMWILQSRDHGNSWKQFVIETGRDEVTPVEPTAWKIDDERILFFTRNGPNGQGANPAQFILRVDGPGRFRVEGAAVTNCTVTGHQDTHDVIYNPVTDRFEATVSDRCVDHSDYSRMALSLWTIPADRLLVGDSTWTFARHFFPPMTEGADAEGTHPGGSVVDLERGKQYLQVHRGEKHAGSSSLYHLERGL